MRFEGKSKKHNKQQQSDDVKKFIEKFIHYNKYVYTYVCVLSECYWEYNNVIIIIHKYNYKKL